MDKWLETPRQYPRLTLDTLAFAIAMDILINPVHHIDYAACFDDQDPECALIREYFPSHDT